MKAVFARLFLILFGLLLGALGVEIAVRAILPPPQSVQTTHAVPVESYAAEPGTKVRLEQRVDNGDSLYRNTPNGKRLRPNVEAVIANHYRCNCEVKVQTNSLGYRNPELQTKDRPRVLFLGDSITFADYISEERTWVRQVETLSQATPHAFETVNAGVFAIGLANYLSILLETGISTHPDAVVIGFYLNDVEASPGVTMLKVPRIFRGSFAAQHAFQRLSFLKSYITPESHENITPEQMDSWKQEFLSKNPPSSSENYHSSPAGFNKAIGDLFFDWGSAWGESVWDDVLIPFFQEFKRLSMKHDFELYFMIFPVELQVGASYVYDYPQRRLKSLGQELDVPVLDLLPPLRKEAREQPHQRLFYDWCHHTPPGQDLIAQQVHNFLRQESAVLNNQKPWKP